MAEHTKEPWTIFDGYDGRTTIATMRSCDATVSIASEGSPLPHSATDANARRIVACVNAMAGVTTDELEQALTMPTGRARLQYVEAIARASRHNSDE